MAVLESWGDFNEILDALRSHVLKKPPPLCARRLRYHARRRGHEAPNRMLPGENGREQWEVGRTQGLDAVRSRVITAAWVMAAMIRSEPHT